ncbi:MAG: response regulator [Ignavibacteriaceae bacterium]
MLDKIVSKYALSELLEIEGGIYAIADKSKKVIWYNKTFKETLGRDRLKGKNVTVIFKEISSSDLDNLQSTKSLLLHIPSLRRNLIITALRTKKKTDGYFLKLEKVKQIELPDETETKLYERNLLFQKELHDILSLLVKEKSLTILSEEILARSANTTKSFFGLIVFQNSNDKKKFEYLWYDPNEFYINKGELEKEIYSSFSFMAKWLGMNKRSLLALNHPNNIGFNLAKSFMCDSLIISPCIFDNILSAALIVGKKDEIYPGYEINVLEQFAALLSFAISNTKTRELNNALETRLLQSQKLETIGKLTSGMAHDFSNLLSSIFGSLNLLKRKVPQNEDVHRLLDNIENCSIRAKDLTKGLLSFGKPTPKRKELIKPNLLLSEISKVIFQTFPRKLTIKNTVEENLYDILGNGTEIYQVLLNLCVNAKEAIEDSGAIELSAKNISVNEKNVMNYPLLANGNYVQFSVMDTGVGIPEENVQNIFDPYFSTKEKETGSGLGLYVTYGIIKAHQGHIEVTSELNKGTTFDVFIPAYEPTAVSDKTEPSEKIILLADDEVMLRDLLAELLESTGYNVIKVLTGVEALKVLTEEIKVDLVILDYNMPEMNGLECITKIRELKFSMPIILSSGSLSLEENLDLNKIGISSMLTKPYEFDTMLSTIQKLI